MAVAEKDDAFADVNLKAYVLLVGTTLCWGGNAVLSRMAVGEISPMLLVTLRWAGALLLMLVFAGNAIRRDWSVLRGHVPYLAIMGILGFTAFNSIFYVAAHGTTAVNIGIIQGAIPVFVLLGAFLADRTPVALLQAAGVALTLAGIVIVATRGSPWHLLALAVNWGDALMVVAASVYAIYAVGLRRRPAVSSLGLFTALAGIAFVASLPLSVAEWVAGRAQWPTATGWWVVALVTVFPSFLAQIFFLQGVALIGPGRAGVFINLVPLFASVMAVVVLGEPFAFYHALALALVLAGIALSERHSPKVKERKS